MSPQRPAASKSAKSPALSPDTRPPCPWSAKPWCAHGARVPPKAGPTGVQRPVSRVAVQARSWKLVHVCPGLCLGDWPARHSNGVDVFLDQFYLVEPLIWNQRGQNQLRSEEHTSEIHSLSLHDSLPIWVCAWVIGRLVTATV